MGSWRKRGNNSYQLTVCQGYDSNGKKLMKNKTINFPKNLTEKQIAIELTIQLDKFEKEVQRGTYLDGNITFSEFAEKWLEDYATVNLKNKTLADYKMLLKRILPALGHKKLNTIQPTHILEFYKNLSECGIRLDYTYKLKNNIVSDISDFVKKASAPDLNLRTVRQVAQGKNTTKTIAEKISKSLNMPFKKVFDIVNKEKKLSQVTIHYYHRLMSSMFTIAVQWQLIEYNPVQRVKPPKITPREIKYYDIDEIHKMLSLLDNESLKHKTIIYAVTLSGLRAGELAALEWSNISFDKKTITVSKQLQYITELGIYQIDSPKTNAGNRTIPIPSSLVDVLKQYKIWQDNEKLLWGDKWIESNKLFTQENGEPIFPTTPSKWFKKFVERNNLPPLTFHQLRHTYGSLLIAQGVDIATVSKLMGHSNPAVTLRIYAHAIKQRAREAADILDNLLIKRED